MEYLIPASSRKIHLKRIIIQQTFDGLVEGNPRDASKSIRASLKRTARDIMPPARPLVVIQPPKGQLPDWLCIAEFESKQGATGIDNEFCTYHSRLYVCFFAKDTQKSMDKMIQEILPELDWENNAEDFDIMDF